MKPRSPVPRKLDMAAFIDAGETLSGTLSWPELPRLSEALFPGIDTASLPPVRWSATGRLVPQRVGEPQRWLDIEAEGEMPLTCQRCLQAVTTSLGVSRGLRFVKDEAAAADLDADSDDDVLALSRQFDLPALIEDELIMAMPIVPRHEVCPTDVAALMRADEEVPPPGAAHGPDSLQEHAAAEQGAKPHPFAALAALKKKPG